MEHIQSCFLPLWAISLIRLARLILERGVIVEQPIIRQLAAIRIRLIIELLVEVRTKLIIGRLAVKRIELLSIGQGELKKQLVVVEDIEVHMLTFKGNKQDLMEGTKLEHKNSSKVLIQLSRLLFMVLSILALSKVPTQLVSLLVVLHILVIKVALRLTFEFFILYLI